MDVHGPGICTGVPSVQRDPILALSLSRSLALSRARALSLGDEKGIEFQYSSEGIVRRLLKTCVCVCVLAPLLKINLPKGFQNVSLKTKKLFPL